MKLLFDFFPIIVFYATFYFTGKNFYFATGAFLVAAFIQIIYSLIRYRKVEKMVLIAFGLGVVFGGATILFHDPTYLKWKVSIVYWLFFIVLLGSQYFTEKPIVQRLMEVGLKDSDMHIPDIIWPRLNLIWALFFFAMGIVNLVVAYFFSTTVWVNFKMFGLLGILLLFTILQGIYIMRFQDNHATKSEKEGK